MKKIIELSLMKKHIFSNTVKIGLRALRLLFVF
jgi:hypothetical protein